MIKATFKRPIARRDEKTGKLRNLFSYELTFDTPEELAEYKKVKGAYYLESEDGKVILNHNEFVGKTTTFEFNHARTNVYADRGNIAEVKNFVGQFDGNLGEAMASKAADMLLNNMFGAGVSNKSVTKSTEVEEKVSDKIDE